MPQPKQQRVHVYIVALTSAAAGGVFALAHFGPPPTLHSITVSAMLCCIAWAGRQLTYEVDAKGARGRVNFLMFPAAAIAAGDWMVPIAVGITVLALDAVRGAEAVKAAFNTAAAVLASALSILVFLAVGGHPWTATASIAALPVAALVLTSRLTNSATMSGVLALAQGQPFLRTWRGLAGTTLLDDIVVSPLIGVIAYAIVAWGLLPTIVCASSLLWVNKLYSTNQALARQSRELLELMVTAIEARDPYTSGHSRRVSGLAREIARVAGLPTGVVERVAVAGLLHDVGKIHEKYAAILDKPDGLTKDEWLLMQEHPVDGEALVRTVSQLHDTLPAIRHHHERWDGRGYPDRLAGDAIPLAARILALADTIDAMSSTRPYRRALTVNEVRNEIQQCVGRQFDPTLATKLLGTTGWHALLQQRSLTPTSAIHRITPPSPERIALAAS